MSGSEIGVTQVNFMKNFYLSRKSNHLVVLKESKLDDAS